jgi:hypothetical protein
LCLCTGLALLGCRGDLVPKTDPGAAEAPQAPVEPDSRDAADPDGADSPGALDSGALAPEAGTADGGMVEMPGTCSGPRAGVAELTAGLVQPGAALILQEVVATSQKFLVSEGQKCWFGAFVSDFADGASGILLVASAPRVGADGAQPCPSGRDALPDDLAPGDVVDAFGTLSEFAAAACSQAAPQLELVVHDGCPVRRRGRVASPAAAVMDAALGSELAKGEDRSLLRHWGGALVRLENVTAVRDGDGADVVGAYGVIRLEESGLEVHDKIYYYDLSVPGPGAPAKAPRFSFPTAFRSITGLVYLDYCTWSLAPRDKCADLDPPSEDCPSP